jgi:hypothetical protein
MTRENILSASSDEHLINDIASWTPNDFNEIVNSLKEYGCELLKNRKEYALFKEVLSSENNTEKSNFGKIENGQAPAFSRASASGVISPICDAEDANDTSLKKPRSKAFLAPLNVQKAGSIADNINSFKVIQSEYLSLNIGFDTEFQDFRDDSGRNRRVLSLQMSIVVGDVLIRYFFLVAPQYQEITNDGGQIPLKYCLADILSDLKSCYFKDFPLVLKRDIVYKEIRRKDCPSLKVVDYKAMRESIIPITIVCHTGKADISVFRRAKYDVDLPRKFGEIQGGWISTENSYIKAENDSNFNYYWLIDLCVRDTLALTPAEHKSLAALGEIVHRPKIVLPPDAIEHMAVFAVDNPVEFYKYAMNDADIVISFCSELFQRNHAIPMTLSSAAASAMCESIKKYFNVKNKSEYDRVYRGLELLDEGLIPSNDERLKFLKATRYVPIRDNPDAKLISEYFEESYTGGFNASFYIGWITSYTIDIDLQNAYLTAMAAVIDLDWTKSVHDFPRDYMLTLADINDPLIPAVAVGDFDFPEDCYCPNIPVPVKGGMKIYPLHGRHVYMSGPDMYLALKLGAKIKIFRGFTCETLTRNGEPSLCLADAVSNLVKDRAKAKILYKDTPLIQKSLKTMATSCYGKTAQNVSPKTRYNAKKMGREDSDPSCVTSPYHASYTTALVRCMLIGCINQLHEMGYNVYSVTTDGFISDAPLEVVRALDAYGFTNIFQESRYRINQTREDCDENHVWEPKHHNYTFLNITTRGNVAVNDDGVLAHNSYTTGEIKDSRADRDAYIINVVTREGRLECKTKEWTKFSDIVERKRDFHVSEHIRRLSMNFDYKRCPIVETATDTPVHYNSVDGQHIINTTIANYDTRPFYEAEEFLNYRRTIKNEDCVKVAADLQRVKIKSTSKINGYIGKDLDRKILLSILMGYRSGLYKIPALDGLKQSEIVAVVNSWGISKISISDWKNCSRQKRQDNMLSRELIDETLKHILNL